MKTKPISADEAHAKRKSFTNDAGVMAKGVPVVPEVVKAAKFDNETREARFVMSAEMPDRMGDIVVQDGLDITNFLANPQALLFHNSRSWPIGSWKDVAKQLGGRPKRTEGTMKLLPEGEDPDADRAARHIANGTMRTVSIGFRPDWEAAEGIWTDDESEFLGIRFNKSELLECSLVPIPALPAATMKELSTGMLSPESIDVIKGVLENFALKDGAVVDRERLEGAVREATGNKSYFVLEGRTKRYVEYVQHDDGGVNFFLREGEPPKPKDGEQVPVAPNPADREKTKGLGDAVIESMQAGYTIEKLADGTLVMRDADGKPIGGTTQKPEPRKVFVKNLTAEEIANIRIDGVSMEAIKIHPLEALVDDETLIDIADTVRAKANADGEADSFMTKLLRLVTGVRKKESVVVEIDTERRQAAIARAAALETEAARALV